MFEFAFTLKPDMTHDHIVALTRQLAVDRHRERVEMTSLSRDG